MTDSLPTIKPQRPRKRRKDEKYTKQLASYICDELAVGKTLRQICNQPGMPREASVREWAMKDRDGFASRYARAREVGYHVMAEQVIDIANDSSEDYDAKGEFRSEHVQRSRLRVDTYKWLISKMLPKIYGDRSEMTVKADVSEAFINIWSKLSDRLADRANQAKVIEGKVD